MTKTEQDALSDMLAHAAHARKAAGELPAGDFAAKAHDEPRRRLLVGAEMLEHTAAFIYWRAQTPSARRRAAQAKAPRAA
jgi:hypothetical protein